MSPNNPQPTQRPIVIFKLSVSLKIDHSLDKEKTMAGCKWSALREDWTFRHNSWNDRKPLSQLGSGVTVTHDLINHQCFTLKRPSHLKIVQTSFITLQNIYIGRYYTWQWNIHWNGQNKQGRGRISKATSTTECYDQLPERLYFLNLCVSLFIFTFRTHLVHGGPVLLLLRFPLVLPQACLYGQPNPCSSITLHFLSGMAFHFWSSFFDHYLDFHRQYLLYRQFFYAVYVFPLLIYSMIFHCVPWWHIL